MLLQERAQLSGCLHEQRVHRNLPIFVVNCQLEAIRKERLHHHAYLFLGGIPLHACLDIETVGGHPLGHLRQQQKFLTLSHFVGELYVRDQRVIHCSEVPAIRDIDIARPQRKIGTPCARGSGGVLLNGSDVERHPSACRGLPIGSRRLGGRPRRTQRRADCTSERQRQNRLAKEISSGV